MSSHLELYEFILHHMWTHSWRINRGRPRGSEKILCSVQLTLTSQRVWVSVAWKISSGSVGILSKKRKKRFFFNPEIPHTVFQNSSLASYSTRPHFHFTKSSPAGVQTQTLLYFSSYENITLLNVILSSLFMQQGRRNDPFYVCKWNTSCRVSR